MSITLRSVSINEYYYTTTFLFNKVGVTQHLLVLCISLFAVSSNNDRYYSMES